MAGENNEVPVRWVRDYLYDILRDLGINFIFGVPGTNEIPVIDGCEIAENNVSYIKCLHENIAMGAAMGYARMTGKPGVVVLHVTPGAGHSIGNLSNAWKSHMPLVVLCGQQQNELVTQEPLLASNVVQIASQFTKWSHELRSWDETALVLQRAFKEAMAPPTGPVFISFPWEFMIHKIEPSDRVPGVTMIPPRFTGDPEAIQKAADLLGQSNSPVIVVGDGVGYAGAWEEVRRLAELTGAPVYAEGLSSMANFPNSDYHWQGELPGDQKKTQARFQGCDVAFLCGFNAQAQITVFDYADGPLIPQSVRQIYLHNDAWEIGKNHYGEAAILGDIKATLPLLNDLLEKNPPAGAAERNQALQDAAQARSKQWSQYLQSSMSAKPIRAVVVADALRQLIEKYELQKKFVYVHEAVSDATPFQFYLPFGQSAAEPISYYCVEGGSLGWSMPATLGINLAREGHQGIKAELVVNAVGDGSSLFYPQVWWTAAQHNIPILYIITNNREYRTLLQGLVAVVRYYADDPNYGWRPVSMEPSYLKIQQPDINFVELAKVFGVSNGRRVVEPGEVMAALQEGFEHVLTQKQSFVVEVFSDPNPSSATPDVLPKSAEAETALKASAAATDEASDAEPPPPLDIFYHLYKEGK
ncbi:MAG TPA: thiamine pyrophosphate-binding protein [Pyrinomonadaceae bacterium]|jgi:benzoylformate decarboxylase